MNQSHQVILVSAAGLTLCAAIIVAILVAHFVEASRVIKAAPHPVPVVSDPDIWAVDLEWDDR